MEASHINELFIHYFINSSYYPLIYSFFYPFFILNKNSSTRPFIHSLIHPIIHPLIHACIHPFIHACIHPQFILFSSGYNGNRPGRHCKYKYFEYKAINKSTKGVTTVQSSFFKNSFILKKKLKHLLYFLFN